MARHRASRKIGRFVEYPQLLDNPGKSLRRYLHAKVTGAARRNATGVNFAFRVKNHVSRPATANAAAILLVVLSTQNDTEMRPRMLMFRYACTCGKAALR